MTNHQTSVFVTASLPKTSSFKIMNIKLDLYFTRSYNTQNPSKKTKITRVVGKHANVNVNLEGR